MSFFQKYYEKIILAAFLLIFIVSLIWLTTLLTKSLEIKEENLEFPKKHPDYKVLTPEMLEKECDAFEKLKSEEGWKKAVPRDSDSIDFTGLLVPYKVARCPNCQRLIPRKAFEADIAKCPLCACKLEAPPPVQTGPAGETDSDGDGLPDIFEAEKGLGPNNPDDAGGDLDKDGFCNLEEYIVKTEVNDVKSHPPLALRLYVSDIKRKFLPLRLIKVIRHGEDKEKWDIQVEQAIKGKKRSKFYRLNNIFDLAGDQYKVIDIIPKIVEEYDKSLTTTVKRDETLIVIQKEGDEPITCEREKKVWENRERIYITDRHADKTFNLSLNKDFIVGDDLTGTEKYCVVSVVDINKKTVKVKRNDNLEFDILSQKEENTIPFPEKAQ